MAHRLELAVKNEADGVNAITHFKLLVSSLYKSCSLSPKNLRELKAIAKVRWAFHLFTTVRAFLNDFSSLHAHFSLLSVGLNGTRFVKEPSNCRGLASKMSSGIFAAQL